MKTSFLSVFLLVVLSVASASHNRAFLSPPTSRATKKAIGIRGGDISKVVSKEGLTKFATVYFALQGIPRAADAATYWEHYGLKIEPGSLAAYSAESNGFSAISVAIMSYLALFSNLPASKIIAYASTPCLFFFFKTCYSGVFKRLGFWEGFGTATTCLILFPICMLFAGKGDPDIVGALVYGPALAMGILGWLLPEVSLKPCGLNSFATPTDKVLWRLQCLAFTFWGIHAYMMMKGKDAFEIMKILIAVMSLAILDLRFVHPITRDVGFSKSAINAYVIFAFLMSASFYAVDYQPASSGAPLSS